MPLTYMRTTVTMLAMRGVDGGYHESNGMSALYIDPDVTSRQSIRAMEDHLRTRLFFQKQPFKHRADVSPNSHHRRITQWMNSKFEFALVNTAPMDTLLTNLTLFFGQLRPMFLDEVALLVSIPLASQHTNKEELRFAYFIPMFVNEQDSTLWNLCAAHLDQEINEPVYDQFHIQSFFGIRG